MEALSLRIFFTQQVIENGLLDMFEEIDVGVNEVESEEINVRLIKTKSVTEIDAEQNKVKPPEWVNEVESQVEFDVGVNEVKPEAIVALPFNIE